MGFFQVTPTQLAEYRRDGFLVASGLLAPEEYQLLAEIAHADADLETEAKNLFDASGGVTSLALRYELSDDYYSAISRSRRLVATMEQMLEGEVYHWHHKLILKQPRVGGAWEWHQDYGYWYDDGCLYPLLATCMIAIDPATTRNGCLQVLPGSHHLGRLDHGRVGQQTAADPQRVAAVLEEQSPVPVELNPGDACFFDCNLLHSSQANRGDDPRWALLCCYNAARNPLVAGSRFPRYAPLEILPDEKMAEMGRRQLDRLKAAQNIPR